MRRKSYTISTFICPGCGNSIPLPRKKSKQRENGHIKDIWCPFCEKKRKFTEIKADQCYRTLNGEEIKE